uniref:G_PROTEIN_RECEP_F1_2 domain-containing protein n=1 Tax=Parastrongyloides trichosuri TaxID=131310 RepID=A0A0N4ZS48_PARTI
MSIINDGLLNFIYNNNNGKQNNFYLVLRYAQNYSNNLIRFSIWFLIIERIVATKKRKTYEKSKNSFIPFCIAILITSLAAILTNLRTVVAIINKNFHQFLLILDIPLVISLFVLKYFNKTIRRQGKSVLSNLTEKYQIIENIKSISRIMLTVCAFVMLSFSDFCIFLFIPESVINYEVRTFLNFTLKCIFYSSITIHLIYASYKSDKEVVHLKNTIKKWFNKSRNNKVFVTSNSKHQQLSHTIKNIDGEEINNAGTQENYFAILDKSWK